jgi:phosphoserine phosphatase
VSFPFDWVLNVVATHKQAAEEAADLRGVVAGIGGAGEIDWLAPYHAFDIPFEDNPASVLNEARAAARHLPADINVVAADNRRKKLLIADMDSTIINCECLDELADMAGLKAQVSAITERAMRGELDFADALHARVAMLKGLGLDALERVWTERVRLNPGARALVQTMKHNGAHSLLVSGGFTYFTQRVAREAGFVEQKANVLQDDGKALTGEVALPILGRAAKLAALDKAVIDLHITADDALAVGDGANDLAMIEKAGLGVAYHAKPVVAAAARAQVDHGDLTVLLYLQGYRDDEIARD